MAATKARSAMKAIIMKERIFRVWFFFVLLVVLQVIDIDGDDAGL